MKDREGCKQVLYRDAARIILGFVHQLIIASRSGQRLPQLTLFFVGEIAIHFAAFPNPLEPQKSVLYTLSLCLLVFTVTLLLCGYTLLIALYRHSVHTIFNRNLPPPILECLPSLGAHLALLKPLEIIFRYATARFRVLPDILVLGEVRCGTTTLCQHLSQVGCVEPFCLWKHPELDRKETFYFVGHYLGHVHPANYRMCFPLKIEKWFYQRILKRPFVVFDGCAQYLTHPAVPYLLAKAYQGQPPPVLVACVRNPVSQALSWWQYENNAMSWGQGMGLSKWNTELRSMLYPPRSISSAMDFSSSKKITEAYKKTEELFQKVDSSTPYHLPGWAMTWPGGQLSGVGRNGDFVTNIGRYERVFSKEFTAPGEKTMPLTSNLNFINVIPLEVLGNNIDLGETLRSLGKQVDRRQEDAPKLSDYMSTVYVNLGIHRNASSNMLRSSPLEPTAADEIRLGERFLSSTQELESMCGMSFGWTT